MSNTPPDGYKKSNLAFKLKVEYVYMINDWIGLNATIQYQANLGANEYSYSYKDLSNVDFTKPFDIVNQQLYTAPTITQSTKGITNSFSLGGGLVLAFKRNKGDYRHGKGVIDIKYDAIGRNTKPNGQDDGNPFPPKLLYEKLVDSLRTITIKGLPNPIDQINGGPSVIASPAINCICTETHLGTCDSDWGEVCGCDGYQTDRTNHGVVYIPKDSLPTNPFIVYKANPKNSSSLENKDFIVTKKIKLDKIVADTMGVEEAYILPGAYKFSKGNVLSLPIQIVVVPANAFYHAITEKGLDGGPKGKPLCPCSCCEKSPGQAWKCCTQ